MFNPIASTSRAREALIAYIRRIPGVSAAAIKVRGRVIVVVQTRTIECHSGDCHAYWNTEIEEADKS